MDVSAPATARSPGVAATISTLPTPVLGAVADKLGISVDALRAQLAAGRPLGTIAQVAGLAHDELVATVARAQDSPPVRPVDETARYL